MTPNDLIAIVMPTGALELEWAEADEAVSRSRALLQEEIHGRYEAGGDAWLLALGFSDRGVGLSPSLEYWRDWAGLFAGRLARLPDLEELRHRAEVPLAEADIEAHLLGAPPVTGAEYIRAGLLRALWEKLGAAYGREIRAFEGSAADFIHAHAPNVHLVGRVFFHLVENKKGPLPFAFLATYSTRLDRRGASRHLPLKYALQEYKGQRDKLIDLLATVHEAAKRSPLVGGLLESGAIFQPLAWTAGEAYRFLKEIPVFEEAGILCRIPNWWKGAGAGARVEVRFGDRPPSVLGMDAILSFDMDLYVGDTPVSPQEARRLLETSEGLAFIKNKWVAVDPEKLRQTLEAYESARERMAGEDVSLADALRLQLNPRKALKLDDAGADLTVSNGEWLASVLARMRDPRRVEEVAPGPGFRAVLRDYQQQGLNWLCFLHALGFGACLADDMGLGKTVQVLAFLNRLKPEGAAPARDRAASLLVVPASLMANWTREIERFAPRLSHVVAHPGAPGGLDLRAADSGAVDAHDLVITTYSMVSRYPWIQSHPWSHVILDEAQAIKNPGAKQTRAVKRCRSRHRLVLTGTPIENRLSDLWSLFDFVNPGLLGSAAEFKQFCKTLGRDRSGYARLRQTISPYLLRRLKTDREVIKDLPEKVEMKTFAPLSRKQAVLYQKIVDDLRRIIERTDGIQRKGLILGSLIKLKQLCNHPDQYLGGGGGYAEEESGKFGCLRDICETIYAKREKVLVFTQFREMTEPLAAFLAGIFRRPGVVLHGSIPVKKRKAVIDAFQIEKYVPFMVLSLKAGGVGLNLTEASHVVHFDRWWNPAVENQATDRAFRIGQEKNVIVHKFVTRGTVEEKIDRMLEEKTRLSAEVVAGSEAAWMTEMDNRQLMEMFSLSL